MARNEFNTRLEQISADYGLNMALIDQMQFPVGTNDKTRFDRLSELRDAAEQKYVNASLALQRAAGIATPVAFGRTE